MQLTSRLPQPGPASSPGRLPSFVLTRGFRAGWQLGRLGAVAGLLYTLLFHVSVVRGNSMSPGIHDGDRILVEPWTLMVDEVDRGDVVVLQYPLDPRLDYIKRVVALPGDDVLIGAGRVWVNGELVEEPYVDEADPDTFLHCRVDEGKVFVLGDNRRRSSDSREFGQVPVTNIRGRVEVRLWPLGRAGFVR